MTWSYSGNPASSSLDEVRFLIGDTDTNNQLTTNEAITWALAQTPNTYDAAALVANSIAAVYAKQMSKTVGPLTIRYAERRDAYYALAKSLLAMKSTASGRAALGRITPINGSQKSETTDVHYNPIFVIGLTDNFENEPALANESNPLQS